MSASPGMRYRPRASMTRAPRGTGVVADAGPSAAIRPSETTTVWSRRRLGRRPSARRWRARRPGFRRRGRGGGAARRRAETGHERQPGQAGAARKERGLRPLGHRRLSTWNRHRSSLPGASASPRVDSVTEGGHRWRRSRRKTARRSITTTGATGQPVVFSHGWPLIGGRLRGPDVLPGLARLPVHRPRPPRPRPLEPALERQRHGHLRRRPRRARRGARPEGRDPRRPLDRRRRGRPLHRPPRHEAGRARPC